MVLRGSTTKERTLYGCSVCGETESCSDQATATVDATRSVTTSEEMSAVPATEPTVWSKTVSPVPRRTLAYRTKEAAAVAQPTEMWVGVSVMSRSQVPEVALAAALIGGIPSVHGPSAARVRSRTARVVEGIT